MSKKQITFLVVFILFGVYWFVPALGSSDLGDSDFFMATYQYLPGIVLPSIVYLLLKKIRPVMIFAYVVLSWGIYYLSIQIFSQEWMGSYYAAAFFGALAFLLATDYFLHGSVKVKFPIIGAVAGAIVFYFVNVIDDIGFPIACFLWTAIAGVMIVLGEGK